MRKITIELYANNEYALDERLKQIRWDINNIIWPSSCFSEGSRKRLESGCIEEETEYKLTDYEGNKHTIDNINQLILFFEVMNPLAKKIFKLLNL